MMTSSAGNALPYILAYNARNLGTFRTPKSSTSSYPRVKKKNEKFPAMSKKITKDFSSKTIIEYSFERPSRRTQGGGYVLNLKPMLNLTMVVTVVKQSPNTVPY